MAKSGKKPRKDVDLTQTDPIPDDHELGQPMVRTGEKVIIESRVLPLVAYVLGAAAFIHFLLDTPGLTAVLVSLAVVIAVDQAQVATRILRWIVRIARRLKVT